MFFEHLTKIILWFLTFGVMVYALFRWGKAGFTGLPGADAIGELFKMLWEMIAKHPLAIALVPIIGFLIWYLYSMYAR
jgi:hypothetical protein